MTRAALIVALAIGCTRPRPPAASPPQSAGACEMVSQQADPASLPGLYADYGPLVLMGDAAFVCGCGTPDRIAGATEKARVAGASERTGVEGKAEAANVAGSGTLATVGGKTESATTGGAAEGADVGGKAEATNVAGADEAAAVGGKVESEKLEGATESVRCETKPECSGYVVTGSAALRVYDGQLRTVDGRCVRW